MAPDLSVEAQLAVLNSKVDTLLELNRTRGEDHEARIRMIEASYISRKASVTLIVTVCTVVAALTNVIAFVIK